MCGCGQERVICAGSLMEPIAFGHRWPRLPVGTGGLRCMASITGGEEATGASSTITRLIVVQRWEPVRSAAFRREVKDVP